jgi:excisionase family DNA binding protein
MRREVGDRPMRNLSGLIEETRETPRAARSGDRPEDRTGVHPSAGNDSLWGITDVSVYLQVPVSSIYKMTARKAAVRIPHIRIGGKLRFRQSDVDRWLTLLTTSNMEALSKMRQKVSQVTHGHDSQTSTR